MFFLFYFSLQDLFKIIWNIYEINIEMIEIFCELPTSVLIN